MDDYQKPKPPAWLVIGVVVICLGMIAGTAVIAQEPVQTPKDNSQQLTLPPQVTQRYTPQFVKYVEKNVIRIDHMILDGDGNLTQWCAIAIEEKETGELIHCLN